MLLKKDKNKDYIKIFFIFASVDMEKLPYFHGEYTGFMGVRNSIIKIWKNYTLS